MAYKYDPNRMKNGAAAIESELETFNSTLQHMDSIISGMSSSSWSDTTNTKFVNKYKRDAKPAAEDVQKAMREVASLLKQVSQKYGNAIDSGNGHLSE